MVTELHKEKTLAHHPTRFKGNLLAALAAFRPLVAAVAKLHDAKPESVIHRDIKPENIFVAADGRLVLGDFGIVFTRTDGNRLTKTHHERVGTADWIAPWALDRRRLEEPSPKLDVFPLGKLLWAMLAGEAMLPLWYFNRSGYDLAKDYFPERAAEFSLVNDLLSKCIVEHETDCLATAADLLRHVDQLISIIERRTRKLSETVIRFCQVCGVGEYQQVPIADERRPIIPMMSTAMTRNAGEILDLNRSLLFISIGAIDVDTFKSSPSLVRRSRQLGIQSKRAVGPSPESAGFGNR